MEEVIRILRHFPSRHELKALGKLDLAQAIKFHFGGIIRTRLLMGYDLDDQFTRSSKQLYYHIRGQKTEKLVVNLIKEWADLNQFSYSTQSQTRVGSGLLELVCGKNEEIGIDVTNAKNIDVIREKWKKRDYHRHLEQLWIMVVANHSLNTYKKLNRESPENVLVIDYRNLVSFLNDLNSEDIKFDIPLEKLHKLKALAKCTFYNREKILKQYKNEKKQRKIKDFNG